VASLALFLCSKESAFITGVDYPIDGGFLIFVERSLFIICGLEKRNLPLKEQKRLA